MPTTWLMPCSYYWEKKSALSALNYVVHLATPGEAWPQALAKISGCFAVGPQSAKDVILCEAAIDAISCAAIHADHLCISTSGARPNPAWLPRLIKRGYNIYCGFDADPTGDQMAAAIIDLHPNVKRIRPSRHDWNDVIKASV